MNTIFALHAQGTRSLSYIMTWKVIGMQRCECGVLVHVRRCSDSEGYKGDSMQHLMYLPSGLYKGARKKEEKE